MKELLAAGQLSFDDCFNLFNCKVVPKPKLFDGEVVFIRSLDTVISGRVNHSWLCGDDEIYFGYSVDLNNGAHTVVWDHLIGDKVFTSEKCATEKADSLFFDKIEPKDLLLNDSRSFEYCRNLDGHRLTATIAKIGDTQLYEHNFVCYHFIRNYPNSKSRDKAYKDILSKIIKDVEIYSAKELQAPVLDVLYKVDKNLYASRGYAEFHGVVGVLSLNPKKG